MGASMTDLETRLTRHKGKWHIFARKTTHGTAQAVWTDLGGCTCPIIAVRVWSGCLGQDKR